ncbi:hypothetical protein B0H12DRAFT_1119236 [Mycena haematopus]|nr:hypothetical protein B0H12DRAFT_1119236 [Mycena haematopus]
MPAIWWLVASVGRPDRAPSQEPAGCKPCRRAYTMQDNLFVELGGRPRSGKRECHENVLCTAPGLRKSSQEPQPSLGLTSLLAPMDLASSSEPGNFGR